MTFRQIEYFLELARSKNFTKAAEACYTTQPNLSRQIIKMEDEVGCQLFVRDKQSHCINLTIPGEYFQSQCQNIMDIYQKTLSELHALEVSEPVRFGTMNGIQSLFETMKEVIHSGKYPNLQIYHGSGQHLLDENKVDICFINIPREPLPYTMPLCTIHAPMIVPKPLCPLGHTPQIEDFKTCTFSAPAGSAGQPVLRFLEEHHMQQNFRVFPNIVFDMESYLIDLLLNNYIGFLVNDNLGKYEQDFHLFNTPELSLEIPIGIKWNPDKKQICQQLAADIREIYQRNYPTRP